MEIINKNKKINKSIKVTNKKRSILTCCRVQYRAARCVPMGRTVHEHHHTLPAPTRIYGLSIPAKCTRTLSQCNALAHMEVRLAMADSCN